MKLEDLWKAAIRPLLELDPLSQYSNGLKKTITNPRLDRLYQCSDVQLVSTVYDARGLTSQALISI
jgi:hypothetical protein